MKSNAAHTYKEPSELPDLGRDLAARERGLIRLLAEWTAEQVIASEEATVTQGGGNQ